jgi:transcriptional regulator NrdR family protein
MHCIKCGYSKTRVYGSDVVHGKSIRYRKCVSCETKFKTEEVAVDCDHYNKKKPPIIFEGVYDDFSS